MAAGRRSTPAPGRGSTAAVERAYQALLRLLPADLRDAWGVEMRRLFRERCARAAARGLAPLAATVAGGLLDVVTQAVAVRLTRRPPSPTGDPMIRLLLTDMRIAARGLVRQPGFTATVVLTLAIGIGATTVAMALLDSAILRPLPYPDPARLVSVVQGDQAAGTPFAPPYLEDLRARTTGFAALAGFSPSWGTVVGGSDERSVVSCYISEEALDLFGVVPVAGRFFRPEEHRARLPVALVTEAFWRRQFGTGAVLDGQRIRLADRDVTVVGIVPSTLRMPITTSIVNPHAAPADVWLPFSLNPFFDERTVPVMNVVGRLAPGVTMADAGAQMPGVAAGLARDYPATSAGQTIRVLPLRDVVAGPLRVRMLLAVLAVGCLLLIGCANIANLMLARSSGRAGELAVRASLGASRGRLVLQMFAESLVLAGAGTVVGLAVAVWAVSALPALVVDALPPSAVPAVSVRVVAAAALVGLGCAFFVGLMPAWRASAGAPSLALGSGGRTTHDAAARRARGALVVMEVALALVLLVGAGLLAASFWRLSQVDPGFDVQRIFSQGVSFPASRYATPDSRRALVDEALARLAALPGVVSAGAVNRLPLGGSNTLVGIEIEAEPAPDGRPISMDRRVVTTSYFDTIGIDVVSGRGFGPEDRFDAEDRVAMLNEAAARRVLSGDAVGRRVRLMLRGGPGPWLRVVGVVADVRHHGLGAPVAPEIYVPYAQAAVESMAFVVRAATPPASLAGPVRAALKSIDGELPVLESAQAAMAGLVDASLARPRLQAQFVNAFGAVALALAAIGIYGVVSYSVTRSRRDIGVRLALGAQRRDVLSMVLRTHMSLVGAGVVIGLGAAAATARLLESLLFGVAPTDPATFAAVTAILLAVGLVAAWVPARRATLVDPVTALRPE